MSPVTLAVSEAAFQVVLRSAAAATRVIEGQATFDFGDYALGYNVAAHLENGRVDLVRDAGLLGPANGAVNIAELDVVWDRFDLTITINLPNVCVGGFCAVRAPDGRCLVRMPRICLFTGDPDITVSIPIGALTRTELSVTATLQPRFAAATNEQPDRWQIHLDPVTVDIDLMDWPDIIRQRLTDEVNQAINAAVPAPLRPVARALLGPIPNLLADLLDLPDDFDEWLSSRLGLSMGLFDLIVQGVTELLAAAFPVHVIPTPYPVIPAREDQPAITVAVTNISIQVEDDEFVATIDVGETA
jgi:hypothetical protein